MSIKKNPNPDNTTTEGYKTDHSPQRKSGERDPLLRPEWRYIEKFNMDDFRAEDWSLMNRQRSEYLREQQSRQVLELLKASKDAPTFGYAINNYEHCLQTATLLHKDGYDEEDIVAGLLHDIGFIVCPENHGQFAADLLRPYISERNIWMLEHHEIFQRIHLHGYYEKAEVAFINERERWRDHPYFEWTAEFVEKYDIIAINPNIECLSVDFFEPMVQRVFSRTR